MFTGRVIAGFLAVLTLLAISTLWRLDQPFFWSFIRIQHSPHSALVDSATRKEFSWEDVLPRKILVWEDCLPRRQCARLIVPLNHSEPDGQEAVIALVRKPALVPVWSKFYRGPVLFNPGGPGGSGVDMIVGTGELFATILGPQFDIVGFDPRGVGHSLPRANFFKTDVERALWGDRGLGTVNNSDEGIARTWARGRVLGQLAGEQDDGYLVHINTDQTARDMLRIVEAHGRDKIQYWGFSYGSVLGATFAAMFPDRIERLVIDGVVDSENYYATLWSNNLLDTDKALDHFFSGCAEAGSHGCSFWAPTADEIRHNLTSLYQATRARPLPIKTENNYGILDYNMVRLVVFSSLYVPYTLFQFLAQGLAELAVGDGRRLFELVNPPPYQCSCDPSAHIFDVVRDAQLAILCNDGDDVPGDLESSEEYFKMMVNTSNWGDIWSAIRLGCVGWPRFPKDHFQGPFEANTSHPILLVGNTADPVTPLSAAKKMSRSFKGSVVLTQDSPGHCSVNAPSLCTQKYIQKYFVHGTLPEPGTVCQTIGKPFPSLPHLDAAEQVLFVAEEERELFGAIQELSTTPFIPFPLKL